MAKGRTHGTPFPSLKELNRERKVRNRADKSQRRLERAGGRRSATSLSVQTEPSQIPLDTIICGDALEVIKMFPSASVDLIVTSPPYNFGLDYGAGQEGYEDAQRWDEYFTTINLIWAECARVLVEGGRIAINVQPLWSDYVPTHHVFAQQLMRHGLLWKGEVLWEKSNYNCKYTAWGSWQSPSMPYFKYTWEFIEVFCKGTMKKEPRVPDAKPDISGDEFKKWVYVRWMLAPEGKMKEFGHPAMFPEEIPERLIKLLSYPCDVVLDPFNGVGTTTVVANRLGRRYVGIDISPEYCQAARKRIERDVHQHTLGL